jgi:hypothetical protein
MDVGRNYTACSMLYFLHVCAQYAVIVLQFYSRNGYTDVATGVENIMLYIIRILYEAVYFWL